MAKSDLPSTSGVRTLPSLPMMRVLASTALVIVTCCALCDFAVTLISVTVKTPAQGRVAQRACFRISQSLLTLDRLGPTQVYDAVVFTSQALSAITSGGVTTTIFLSLSYLLSVASRRKHASPEAKKLVRLARALLNLASITWAFISLLRHIPGFCPVGQKNGSVAVDGLADPSSRNPSWLAIRPQIFVWLRRRDDVANSLRCATSPFCHATMGTRVSSHSQRSLSTCRSSHLYLAVSISSSISECLCPKHLASRSSDCCAHLRHRLPGAWGACELCEREATSYPGS